MAPLQSLHSRKNYYCKICFNRSIYIYIYILTILDLDKDKLETIQCVINNCIAYNKYETTNKCKSWISNIMLYGDLKDGHNRDLNEIEKPDYFL